MTQLSDEILVAYADGELIGEEAEAVERALANDPQAQETLRLFRDTAELSRAAFDDIAREPVPPQLIAAASGRSVMVAAPRRKAVGGIAGLALAASVLLAVGVGGGVGLTQLFDVPATSLERWAIGALPAGDDGLRQMLETLPGGRVQTVGMSGDGAELMLLTTFVDRSGRYCRDFEVVLPDSGDAAFGIGCRSANGDWRIEALIAAPEPAPVDGFVAASGPADDPFAVLLDGMTDGFPLSAADEARLLEQGWR